ncbi:hypothetical protein PR048_012771 [Dryococelus australis]|uniref:Uncharacterized protein n=1 Tax=Dryococelus australis TaxID=614101 RepID=A0ABQ9HQA6_9NEOP|nr:hypothetical protein PR048_012771 [Dryococelus australis]
MADGQVRSEVGDQYISVTSAVKLIAQLFEGSKWKLREFLDNIDADFDLEHPDKHSVLLKFVKSKIVKDAKSKILARERTEAWEDVIEIVEENYATRRMINYYACRLFNARQRTSEGVANWGSQVDTLVTNSMEAALWVCMQQHAEGTLALVQHLAQTCFAQGLYNDHIQTIIQSKGTQVGILGLTIEAALEEESNIQLGKDLNK